MFDKHLDCIDVACKKSCRFNIMSDWMFSSNLLLSFDIITVSDAVSILGEYVKDEPWLKLLCDHLKYHF